MTINEIHLIPKTRNPRTEDGMANDKAFVRNVISSTHILKNGKPPGYGFQSGTRSFSAQKAKAVRLSDYSFPVFIIRKPKQRSSYSKPSEGIGELIPSVEPNAN